MRERIIDAAPRRRRSRFLGLAIASAAPIALGAAGAALANASDLKGRLANVEGLRPSTYASIGDGSRHAFTVRDFDPLVAMKYATVSADPEKDVTLVVYASAPDKSSFGLGQLVRIAGARAIPATIVVPSGVPILFRNDDPFTHHISGPDLERDLKPGEQHNYQPKTKGTLVFTDGQTPSVKLWAVIDDGATADRWAARDGSLRLTELAAGEYTLKAFFEGKEKSTASFKVPATGSVELKDPLTVGPPPAASATK